MNSKYVENDGLSISDLLDPSNPLVLTVVLPAAVLGAMGFKRGAILWIMAAAVWSIGKQVI